MYTYQVILEMDDRKSKKKGALIRVEEFVVANSFEDVVEAAALSAEQQEGEIIAIIRRDPIIKVLSR